MLYADHQYSETSEGASQAISELSARRTLGAAKTRATKVNRLLAALPATDMERLEAHLEFVPLALGDVLYQSGGRVPYVYFPTTSIVSLQHTMADGASTEIALVGNDGVAGVSLCTGEETSAYCAVVTSAGGAFRLANRFAKQEFARPGAIQRLFLRYWQTLLGQIGRTAVCNRHHALEQQLCRRLLLNLDRLFSNEFSMTHQSIANMLGVRREGVTEAAGRLQSAGLIRYARGRMTVIDRSGLEARSCECYAAGKHENEHVMRETAMAYN